MNQERINILNAIVRHYEFQERSAKELKRLYKEFLRADELNGNFSPHYVLYVLNNARKCIDRIERKVNEYIELKTKKETVK